jgi:hypothetical protein
MNADRFVFPDRAVHPFEAMLSHPSTDPIHVTSAGMVQISTRVRMSERPSQETSQQEALV